VILYLDNDVLVNLATYDLWNPFLKAFNVGAEDIRIVPTARYSLLANKPQRAAARYGPVVASRLTALVEALQSAPPPAADAAAALANVPRIDPGEAILFLAAQTDASAIVVTGDKNALHALATDARCSTIASALAGRVHCWEQVLSRVRGEMAFEDLRARVVSHRDADTATRAIFGSGEASTEARVDEALAAYILDARSRTGALLGP
jgi:hypothetical protein